MAIPTISLAQFNKIASGDYPFTPPCAANKPKGKKNHHA